MADVGRNEPCPCGSGKKFKKCCAGTEGVQIPEETRRALTLHQGDQQLVEEMLRWAKKRYGKGWLQDAADTYFGDYEEGELEVQLLVPWSVYHFEMMGKTVAQGFLEERGSRLSDDARQWLEAQARSWVSVWEVLEVKAGEGLWVRDLLTAEERFVHEVKGSKILRPRDNLLGRIVDCAGLVTFCGMHPRTLPPAAADLVVQDARDVCQVESGQVPVAKLQDSEVILELIDAWHGSVEEHDAPKPFPRIHNTDGDPLLLTKDHFDFSAEKRALVLERLQRLEGAQELSDESGQAEVPFTRTGNANVAGLESTLIGRALIGGSRLTVETNSTRRADDVRRLIEGGLTDLVRHRLREHSDIEALMKAMPPGPHPLEVAGPELQAVLRDFKEKHMTRWLEEKIPALEGLTPREAAAEPKARLKLDLLLRDMEHQEARLPPEEQCDFHRIRNELGISS